MTVTSAPGRRDRKKAATRKAISRAAAELFSARGFAGTTTLEVSEAADVAEGTLFRYAATKQELLLLVINDRLAESVAEPVQPIGDSPEDKVMAILDPILELAKDEPVNGAPYLREVLFGADGPERAAALEIIAAIRSRLEDALRPHQEALHDLCVEEAADWVFSALVSEVLRTMVGRDQGGPLRARVRVLLRGLGVTN